MKIKYNEMEFRILHGEPCIFCLNCGSHEAMILDEKPGFNGCEKSYQVFCRACGKVKYIPVDVWDNFIKQGADPSEDPHL